MQIVINIPAGFDWSKVENGSIATAILLNAVRNGTPLPKGHGRLIDENKISSFGWDKLDNHAVVTAPTIIEADKAESEE